MSSQQLLHPRNLHQGRYDLATLVTACPALAEMVISNVAGQSTIDFTNPKAVLLLNQALLATYYKVKYWQLPAGYLCPPIPGRADYVHYLADVLARGGSKPATGKRITLLDIGTGANVIYPIIASQSYGWQVTASDIDPIAIKAAKAIVAANPALTDHIKLVLQANKQSIFSGVITPQQRFYLTMCNPPFYASKAEAEAASERKWLNLGKQGLTQRNFAGQQHELWCDGGELAFIRQMINESQLFKQQVCWFSSLVSQQKNLAPLTKMINVVGASQSEVIEMRQGQKVSRILLWSYFTPQQQMQWF